MPLEHHIYDSKVEALRYIRQAHPPSKATMAEIKKYYRIRPVTKYRIIRYPNGDAKGKW